MDMMSFFDMVEINPRVKIEKAKEYPFVEMGIVEPGSRYVRADHHRIFKNGGAKFLPGDILFARITPCLENGKIAQYQGTQGQAAFGSTEFFVFRARPKISDSAFVYYLTKSDIIRKPAEKSMSGASGRQRADLKSIVDLQVPCPPLPTQRKIAAILSAYDDLIENNMRRIKILEEMAQNLYREWFVKFRFPGHQNARFVDSPLGRIPEGWSSAKLNEVCDSINYGYTASANREMVGPKFLRITDIVPSIIEWEKVPYCEIDSDDADKYELLEGDIVIARTGATTGYAKRLNKRHPKSIFASYLVRIRPNNILGKYYAGIIVESTEYKEFIRQNLGGAAQPQANAKVLTSIDILIPPADLIQSFDEIIQPFVDKKELLQIENQTLRRTRDLLLPRLISGEVDLSELDIMVPEEVAA